MGWERLAGTGVATAQKNVERPTPFLTFRYGNAKWWRKIETYHRKSHFLCIQLFFLNIFQFQKKSTFYQNMDGMVGKILSIFRILPFWPTLQQIDLKKNNTKKYGYIRAWVWRQFVPACIVLTNVQGRQAILTKCHPDNMSSWHNVCWPTN